MAEKESSEGSSIEERVELMVDHTSSIINQNPTKRIAHFLKPSLNINALPPPLPKIQSFSSLSKPNVHFVCRSTPLKGWKTWVDKLEETHKSVWRKAGIFDAIKGSTYHIDKDSDLIYCLVERWCPETNTFVFPWGEATVTLEDVYVLGGFSPLGVSVLSKSCLGENVEFVENELVKAYNSMKLMDGCYMSHLRWQEYFMRCGDIQMEHAGFLCLWLSRHVFSSRTASTVTQALFSTAARISCGAKLAFGTAVLGSIYGDLTLMKRKVVGPVSSRPLKLTSPMHLVQIWAWERFPSLGPVPRMINCGEIRLARWVSHVRKLYDDIDDMEMCLDSSRETFNWRPYAMSLANWSLPRFYVDSGMWVDVDSHKEWKLFVRCLMISQLVGLDCVEGYNPHRVALQFGFDQDIPGPIDRSKASCKLGWLGYKKNLRGVKLYIPPRLHVGDVTHRYSDWWRARSNLAEEMRVGCKRKKRTRKRVEKMSKICDGNHIRVNSQEDPSTDEDELRYISYRMGECNHNSDHNISHNEVEENDINIRCSELAETGLNSPGENAVGSGFAAIQQNLANEVVKVRPEGGTTNSEVNAREHNRDHNVIEHRVKMEVKTSGSLLAEDEPTATLREDDIPAGNQLAVSNDANSFVAFCVQYGSRISRLERIFSALLGTEY